MNSVDTAQFKTLLLTRQKELQEQESTQDAAKQELAQIEGALRRITSDDYGYCFKCDEEIDPKRLTFNPCITRCVRCADK